MAMGGRYSTGMKRVGLSAAAAAAIVCAAWAPAQAQQQQYGQPGNTYVTWGTNTTGQNVIDVTYFVGPSMTGNTGNLIRDGSCNPDYIGNPKLGAFGYYGGPTPVLPLIAGSKAIDAARHPALLLVDDPVSRLDPEAANDLLRLLEQFAISGVTVLLAAQREPERLPARSRLVRIDHGALV